VASDRISAFDVVLPTAVPDKGRVLTGLTWFWLERTRDLVPNHLLGIRASELPRGGPHAELAGGRCSVGASRCCPSSGSCAAI
jgi:phosphoribosylaminoimidazole-succinocarboxamide synthase